MILFNSDMQKEKIASILLVIILIAVISAFILTEYGDEIFENVSEKKKVIEYGDCAVVNYIGRYASNNSIFDSSYLDPENKTGGISHEVFVTLEAESLPPEGYENFSQYYIEGFIKGLKGLKQGQTATIGPIPPEEAYGIKPKIGDVINLTTFFGYTFEIAVVEIQENKIMPADPVNYQYYYGNITTTLYTIRENWHYVGEVLESYYIFWDNSTAVTKINETLIWMYTTPTTELGENFTYSTVDAISTETIYPENTSSISKINDSTIVITHNPMINDNIIVNVFTGYGYSPYEYTVESVTSDIINTSIADETGNKTYLNFDRTTTIERNETYNITTSAIPKEILEDQLFSVLRSYSSDFKWSFDKLADETLYFDVTIEKVYKTS